MMQASQQDHSNDLSDFIHQDNEGPLQNPDYFAFLRTDEEKGTKPPSFFSENDLGQDILKVTGAEPDICLEVFYALYHTLWPQIESQAEVSFNNAWTRFIGSSIVKGILCPPEKLITERRVRDIKRSMSEAGGETWIFQDLDGVVNSILNLKQQVDDYSAEEIFHKKEIIESLNLIQGFYLEYRSRVKALAQVIFEKEQMDVSSVSESDELEDLLEPKAIMMSEIFSQHWAYRISRNRARKLLSLDIYGRNLQNNSSDPSNHRVIALPEKGAEPLVFFKANGNPPIQPEKEFMLESFYKHLQIPVPETAFLILTDVFETNSDYFYAVQASEAVLGEPPLKAYQDQETVFDHEAYASQVVAAFLTNPSDGSFKNFKFSTLYKTFVSIDNDLVFKPELTGKDEKKVVNVKSILYLFPQIDLPIPESIQAFFTTLDPHLTILAWLQDLSQKNWDYQLLFTRLTFQKTRCHYQNLFPQSEALPLIVCLEQKVYVDPHLDSHSFYPQILVSKDLLTSLLEKLQIIGKTLLNNRSVTLQAVFEEVFPVLGKYYRKLRLEFNDPDEALEALWGHKKNGVDYSFLSSLLDVEEFSSLPHKQIESDENLVPETFFKEYKDILILGDSALDRFIRRHSERKKKNALNLQIALKELRFLIQEGLMNSQSIREIIEFCQSLSKTVDHDNNHLTEEIISLLSNLPHPELRWLMTIEKSFLRSDRNVPKDLIVSSTPVLGALMKQRTFLLTESENQYLFDEKGDIRKNSSLSGRSRVTCFPEKNPQFYLKQYPEWPGYEFASTLFMRLLGVQHLPYQDLIIVNSKYPVLLTQRVDGHPILRVWDNNSAFYNLDPVHTGLLIISAMLLNPEDGKEDNFILSQDKRYLIPIDNDHCFLPSFFQKEGNFWNAFTVNTALQTKTLLFCLDEMYMCIPSEVRQHIISIDFDLLLTKWMAEVDKIENKFNNLTDQDQRGKFLEQGTVMRIPFYKQFIHNIYWKAHKIQEILRTTSRPTPFDLLKAVEPFAAKCYQDAFKKKFSVQTRFKTVTDQLYTKTEIDGSRMSILNTRTMMEIINISEKDLQNDAMFQRMGPIDAFELLNQLIRERDVKSKKEHKLLCELDAKNQETIWISLFGSSPVEMNLKAFFANPQEGLVLKGSKLITKSKLTELFAQTPDKGMRIRFLSLPESPLLTDKEIRILAEECPNIEYLDVSGCTKLKEIITTEGEWPLLVRLEANDCPNLGKLVSYSPIKILRIENDCKTEILVEKSPLDIFRISCSQKGVHFDFLLKNLKDFELTLVHPVSNDQVISHLIKRDLLYDKWLKDQKITIGTYSISSLADLTTFITTINLQHSKIDTENIQKLIMLNLRNLESLDLSENKITGTDILELLIQGNWPKLNHLNLSSNKIGDEGIKLLVQGNWPKLDHLSLFSNEISDEGIQRIIEGNWPFLKTLDLDYTKVTMRGLFSTFISKNWPHLNEIKWTDRSFISSYPKREHFEQGLFQKNWPLLEEFDFSYGKITKKEIYLIVNKCTWPRLKHLNLSSNDKIDDEALQILTQGNWPFLEILDLEMTKITANGLLNLILKNNWPHLNEIKCRFDKKFGQSLLQRNWPLLEKLNFFLTDVTPNEIDTIVNNYDWPKLKDLNLSHNREIGERGFRTLAQGEWPFLEILNLEGTEITTVGLEAIVKKANWPQLKELNLSQNSKIDDEGFCLLAKGNWPFLESLDLEETTITTVGLEAIVKKAKWPQLKYLNITPNDKVDDEGLRILSQGNWPQFETLYFNPKNATMKTKVSFLLNTDWPKFKGLALPKEGCQHSDGAQLYSFIRKDLSQLESLKLNDSKVTVYHLEKIINHFKCPNLKFLNLSDNDICLEKVLVLVLGECPLLEELHLENTKIPFEGIKVLGNQSKWPQLKYFNLSNNEIYDKGLSQLVLAEWPLLEDLNLSNTKLSLKAGEKVFTQLKWLQLKHLNISNNEIFDEGLSALGVKEWPLLEELNVKNTKITQLGIEILVNKMKASHLKKLDISENSILDGGLKVLTSGNWPLFEHLVYYQTQVTLKGHISLLESFKWQNFNHLEHSLTESFYNFNEDQDKWSPSEIILANLSMYYNVSADKKSILVTVLDTNWLSSKDIHLSISHRGLNEEIVILPREKLNKLDSIELSLDPSLISFRVWPPSLKRLDLSKNYLSDKRKLGNLFFEKCHHMEDLLLPWTDISSQGLEILISRSSWPTLKKIDLSNVKMTDDNLKILASAKWQLLEELIFKNSEITQKGIAIIATTSDWSNLKKLDLTGNKVGDKGLELLVYGKWKLLEDLILDDSKITNEGVEVLVNRPYWPNLKKLDISSNNLQDDGFYFLASSDWQKLEELVLKFLSFEARFIKDLVKRSNWPNLKKLDISRSSIDENEFYFFLSAKWPFLELLNLASTDITAQGLATLINSPNWPNMKALDLSETKTSDDGLEVLASLNWRLLESLKLKKTKITDEGIKSLVSKADWPNLKTLDVSVNEIQDEGLEALSSGKLTRLENLKLKYLKITEKGISSMASQAQWPCLKLLDLSGNRNILNEGLESLASGKWPLLESLSFSFPHLTLKDIEILVNKSAWPNLRKMFFTSNFEDYSEITAIKKLISKKWLDLQLRINR